LQIGPINTASLLVRLLAGLALLSATILVFQTIKSHADAQRIIEENEKELVDLGTAVVPRRFKVNKQILAAAVTQLALNKDLAEAFAKQDREGLAEIALIAYDGLSESNIDLLHFHLPNNVTLFRAHRPEKYGDDLTEIRPMLDFVNSEKEAAIGWERGVHGMALRHIQPMFYEGEYIGALEAGMFLGERILNIWKSAVTGEWFLCRIDAASIVQVAGTRPQGCSTDFFYEADQALREKGSFVRSGKGLLIQKHFLPDYFGNTEFYIKRIIDSSEIRQLAIEQRRSSLLMGVTVLVVASLIFAYLIRSVLRPLESLAFHAKRIAVGQFDDPITVKTSDEIGTLAAALEKMRVALKEQTAELESRGALFRTLTETASEWILWLAPDFSVMYCSPSCHKITGFSNVELKENPAILHDMIHRDDQKKWVRYLDSAKTKREELKHAFRLNERSGSTKWIQCGSSAVFDEAERLLGVRVSITDITSQKSSEEQLRRLSYVDSLTGAYNRAFMEESIESFEAQNAERITVVAADVDGLKDANDTFGHAAGDELLKAAVVVMRDCLRKADRLIRMGGDEFVILMPDTEQSSGEAVIERIENEIGNFNRDCDSYPLSISFGVAFREGSAASLKEVMELADQRMYQSKKEKRKRQSAVPPKPVKSD